MWDLNEYNKRIFSIRIGFSLNHLIPPGDNQPGPTVRGKTRVRVPFYRIIPPASCSFISDFQMHQNIDLGTTDLD